MLLSMIAMDPDDPTVPPEYHDRIESLERGLVLTLAVALKENDGVLPDLVILWIPAEINK